MSFSFRPLLISAALLAKISGCSATVERSAADRAEDVESGGESDDDAADDGEGEDEDEDLRDPDGTARSSLCPSSTFSGGSEEAIAVTWTVDAVDLVLRDGRTVALQLPAEPPPDGTFARVSVVVGSGRVAVTRGWTTAYDGTGTNHATTRWFDRTGAQVEELVSAEGLWVAHLMPDGGSVMVRVGGDWGYVARRPDGSVEALPEFDVWGPPLASGWLVGHDRVEQRVGFLDPVSGERRLLETTAYPAIVEDGFMHLAAGADGPSLVHVTPDTTRSLPLPALAGHAMDQLGLEPVPGSRWLLVSNWSSGARWRVDGGTGEVIAIDATPPAGSELLTDGCGITQPRITSSGDVMATLRSAGDGEAAITPAAGGDWQTLGLPFAQPGTLEIREAAGTFLLTSDEGSNTYCPIVGWDRPASADALPAGSAQIVRPSAGARQVLEEVDLWSLHTTRDGGCVTYTNGASMGQPVSRTIVDAVEARPVTLHGDSLLWID